MAVAIVVSTADGDSNTTVTTDAINTTGANLLVAFCSASVAGPGNAPTDSNGNTWRQCGNILQATNVMSLTVWVSVPSTVGSGHTFTLGGTVPSIAVYALSGAHPPLGHGTSSSATSLGTGDVTTAQQSGIILSVVSIGGAVTNLAVGDGFTLDHDLPFVTSTYFGLGAASKITSTGTETPDFSWTTARSCCALRIVINEDHTGGGGASSYAFVG